MCFTLLCYAMLLLPGAGSGIGRAVCQVLAKEGARVIAADQNGMAAQETKGLISGKTNLHR
jgi:17beta-estradiol 17-dehydrogenase/3alpha(17beta)-hydroxysteroid dehydrogenase (NAD+)